MLTCHVDGRLRSRIATREAAAVHRDLATMASEGAEREK